MTDNVETRTRTPEEIEREIERTRAEMTRDIDEIGERLSPGHLKMQARDSVVEAKEAVVTKVRDAAANVGNQARHAGESVVDTIRANPLPAVLVGGALAWLLMRNRDAESADYGADEFEATGDEYRYRGTGEPLAASGIEASGEEEEGRFASVRHRVGEKRERLAERVRGLKGRTGEQAREASGRVRSFFEENPLVVGAGVLVLGAAIGSLLPETDRENRVFGRRRDELLSRAKAKAGEVKEAARETIRSAKETAKSELREVGPGLASTVKDSAKRVVEDAKETARRETDERDLTPSPGIAPQ